MMNAITEISAQDLTVHPRRGENTPISVQGIGGNDFTWVLEKSLNGGDNWQALTLDDESEFTGSQDFNLGALTRGRYRLRVTSMGAASSILYGTV